MKLYFLQAKPLLETKNYPDLIDKRILDSHDVHQLFWMVLVAEKCLKKDPDNRWTMEQVCQLTGDLHMYYFIHASKLCISRY